MRFYTKEWSTLMDSLGTIDMFEPVIDKDYTDEEIEALYQDFMDKYVQEEHSEYDEPPIDLSGDGEIDPEDFDPEDYLIEEFDGDGETVEFRHPADIDELRRYQSRELAMMLEEFENREPFDEEEAMREFEENYRDFLEEPDEDVPQWLLDTVDLRLLAMGALPEGAYKKLMAQEAEMQERFDALDAAADEALEDMYAEMPDEYTGLLDDMDELDGDYIIGINREEGELELILSGWDEDGDPVRFTALFDGVEIIEDEGFDVNAEVDEDGDYTSDCDLEYHELYFEDGRFEVHFLIDDGELKYLTFTCDDISISQSAFDD